MDADIVMIGLLGLLAMALEGFLWGMMGTVLFKFLRVKDKFWVAGAIVTGLLYFLYEEIIIGQMMAKLGLQVNNEAVSELIGDALYTVDASDLVFSLVAVLIGFWISKKIVDKMLHRNRSEQVEPMGELNA